LGRISKRKDDPGRAGVSERLESAADRPMSDVSDVSDLSDRASVTASVGVLARSSTRSRFGRGQRPRINADVTSDFDDDLDADDLDADDLDADNRDSADRGASQTSGTYTARQSVPTLPDGVRTVAWDYASLLLPKERLSAVIFEDRLLILPIHEAYLDAAYKQVRPDPSVWEFLRERSREASVVPIAMAPAEPVHNLQQVIDLTVQGSESLARGAAQIPLQIPSQIPSQIPAQPAAESAAALSPRFSAAPLAPTISVEHEDVNAVRNAPPTTDAVETTVRTSDSLDTDGDPAQAEEFALLARGGDVSLARPMWSGVVMGAPAVELSDVSVMDDNGVTLLTAVDLTVATGELVVILGARKRAARALMGLISSLVQPTSGLVLHDGVPVRLSVDDERWRLVRPGVLPRRSDFTADRSAVDHVAFPMLVFGVEPTRARRHAAAVIAELGGELLIPQPVQFLTATERHVLAVARALAGPWPTLYLHDPLSEVPEPVASRMRAAVLRRSDAGRTVIMLSDDPWILGQATRVIGVNAGTVFEAANRGARP
jgi:putative ABC transport system ATP-binding protein